MREAITTAIIIAGGKGTRLHEVTSDLAPKSLVEICKKPIAHHQLDMLQRNGIKRVIFIAGHLAEQLKSALGSSYKSISLEYIVEPTPLGTGGGLKLAENAFTDENFLVLYGDIIADFDIQPLLKAHRRFGANVTLVVHPNDHPSDSDLIAVDDDNFVTGFLAAKTRTPGYYRNLVSAAIYLLSRSVFEFIEPDVKQDFIRDIFPKMLKDDMRLFAYNTTEYLKDAGTPKRIEQIEMDMHAGIIEAKRLSSLRPALFLDRDGVINEDRGDLRSVDDFELIPGSASAIKRLNQAGYITPVVTNQPTIAKGFATLETLKLTHAKMETLLGNEGAYVDRIYFCPHHPEQGYAGEVAELKRVCGCRKPNPGMLIKASEELPIDLERSFLIGDRALDMGAARNLGIFAIGVRSGFGCKNCTGPVRPDAMFSNLAQAVDFLLEGLNKTKPIVDKVAKVIEKKPNGLLPVIAIGGISRSGKSALAFALEIALKKRGIKALKLSLDDWITPASERKGGTPLAEHFHLEEAKEALIKLRAGKAILSPGYEAILRGAGIGRLYDPSTAQVIIAEGVLGVHKIIKSNADFAIYVSAPEEILRERFFEFYRWKGKPDKVIEELYEERKNKEWPEVIATKNTADMIFEGM